jgi:lipoprotein-anchoring transpeptidase ErfK/SrfK
MGCPATIPFVVLRRVGLVGLLVVLLAACGGGGRPTLSGKSTVSPSTAPSSSVSQVAKINASSVAVYPTPSTAQAGQRFPNPWPLNNDPKLPVPQVFLVVGRQTGWVHVLLPVRPNGTTGWVKASDVTLQPDPYRITVALGAHQLTVFNHDAVLLQDTVADGAPVTPTPVGTYYLRVLLKAPDPTTVYGPYAYGLSGHSDTLDTFDGGDAELGIHGNNDPTVLGQSISHGCIRMSNAKITQLAGILPLGTPVQITA